MRQQAAAWCRASSRVAGEYMVQSALGVKPLHARAQWGAAGCSASMSRRACSPWASRSWSLRPSARAFLHGTDKGYARAAQLAEAACSGAVGANIRQRLQWRSGSRRLPGPHRLRQHIQPHAAPVGAGTAARSGGADAALPPAGSRTLVNQRAALQAAWERIQKATDGCPLHSSRLEELAWQLTTLAAHQEALTLRDGSGEQPQCQPLMPVTNAFNSSSVKRVQGALDGNGKRKAAMNAAQRRTAACPADPALLPGSGKKKRKLTWQQELAADGGDVAAAKWLSQLPADVKGSWIREPNVGGELLSLVVD